MRFPTLLLSLTLALGSACLPEPARAQASPASPVKDFDVFVDPPTGFVFLKLPGSWKFVGKLDEAGLRALPARVVTSLLPPDPADAPLAEMEGQLPRKQ